MVVEHAFHDGLTIVERAFDPSACTLSSSTVVIIRCTSEMRLRKEHEEVGARATAEGLDRGAAGIARGRDHDRGALPARCQRLVHEPSKSCIARSLNASVGP